MGADHANVESQINRDSTMSKKVKKISHTKIVHPKVSHFNGSTPAANKVDKYTEHTGKCYANHPALDIAGYKIYGGSCSTPIITDADIYVGFDAYGMHKTDMAYPWEEGESFLYPITDMMAPKNPESFAKLIDWLAQQLIAQKKIHLGCIGGHGRTGLVLAALVKAMTNDVNAIEYVRKNYCKKAVESEVQMQFLSKHFGITPIAPSKGAYGKVASQRTLGEFNVEGTTTGRTSATSKNEANKPKVEIAPAKHASMVWHQEVLFDKA